jgi:SAM-dependent methyltransferase
MGAVNRRVGCGTGTITLGLAEMVSHVVGVDPSNEEFADPRRSAAEHHIENVELRVGSVYALDFPDQSVRRVSLPLDPASCVVRPTLLDGVALRGLLPTWPRGRGEGRHANRDTAPWRRHVARRRLPGGLPG